MRKTILILAIVPFLASCAVSVPIGPEAKFGTIRASYVPPNNLPLWSNLQTYAK